MGILKQQNCVDCYRTLLNTTKHTKNKNLSNECYIYAANSHNISMRLRIPRIITHTYENYGGFVAQIITAFSMHGRLTIQQSIEVAESNFDLYKKRNEKKNSKKHLVHETLIKKI